VFERNRMKMTCLKWRTDGCGKLHPTFCRLRLPTALFFPLLKQERVLKHRFSCASLARRKWSSPTFLLSLVTEGILHASSQAPRSLQETKRLRPEPAYQSHPIFQAALHSPLTKEPRSKEMAEDSGPMYSNKASMQTLWPYMIPSIGMRWRSEICFWHW